MVFSNIYMGTFFILFLKWLQIVSSDIHHLYLQGSIGTNEFSDGIHVQSVNSDCDIWILFKFHKDLVLWASKYKMLSK